MNSSRIGQGIFVTVLILLLPLTIAGVFVWLIWTRTSWNIIVRLFLTFLFVSLGISITVSTYDAVSSDSSPPVATRESSSDSASQSSEPSVEESEQSSEQKTEESSSSSKTEVQSPKDSSQQPPSKESDASSETQATDASGDKPENTSKDKEGSSNRRRATVISVVDGDTYKVRFSDGSTDAVRMLGVDTPETYAPNTPGEYGDIANIRCLGKWGRKATDFVTERIDDKQVTLVFDERSARRGKYGRLLAYTEIEGDLLSEQLLEDGYARVYTAGIFTRKKSFLEIETVARQSNRGLWGCPKERTSDSSSPSRDSSDDTSSDSSSGTSLNLDQYTCETNEYNCSDFEQKEVAQGVYDKCGGASNDVHYLDADGDGQACESLE